jgi:adenylate cyclase
MRTVTNIKQPDPPMSLHVVTTDGSPFDHALDGESFVIGRSSKADYFDQGMWHVEDLGSRNGTLLGGRPVNDPARLGHGSVVQVGSTSITLRETTRPSPSGARRESSSDSHTIFRSAAELLEAPEEIRTDSVTPMGEGLRRYADRLRLLTEVNLALDRVMSLEDLLELILDRAFEHFGPEDAAIYLRNDKGGYECAASRSVGQGDPQILFSTSLMEQVVEGGQAALVLDAQTD